MSWSTAFGPTAPSGQLDFIPWPLEHLIRQYLGFDESVVKEYNSIFQYYDDDCLRYKRPYLQFIIAQWRGMLKSTLKEHNPYIYQFRFAFKNNFDNINNDTNYWLSERISEPRCLYKYIVKTLVPVGRVLN